MADEGSIFRCAVCDAEFHYMDIMTLKGDKMCLSCLRATAESQADELTEARADVARFEAELGRRMVELERIRGAIKNEIESLRYSYSVFAWSIERDLQEILDGKTEA